MGRSLNLKRKSKIIFFFLYFFFKRFVFLRTSTFMHRIPKTHFFILKNPAKAKSHDILARRNENEIIRFKSNHYH